MILAAAVAGAALAATARPEELTKQPVSPEPAPDAPPSRLSNDPNHADFHPSYLRVGVMIDGAERRDCAWYDAPRRLFRTVAMGRRDEPQAAETITTFWRWPESRQERRARERWEGKRK